MGVYAMGSSIYAGTIDGLSISSDGGSTFTNRTTDQGLGSTFVHSVYASGSSVYAGTSMRTATDGGLGLSTNGGSSFTNTTTANGLGSNSVLRVYASGDKLYASTTNGLSIAQLPAATPVPGPLPLLGASAAFRWSRRLRRLLG